MMEILLHRQVIFIKNHHGDHSGKNSSNVKGLQIQTFHDPYKIIFLEMLRNFNCFLTVGACYKRFLFAAHVVVPFTGQKDRRCIYKF